MSHALLSHVSILSLSSYEISASVAPYPDLKPNKPRHDIECDKMISLMCFAKENILVDEEE